MRTCQCTKNQEQCALPATEGRSAGRQALREKKEKRYPPRRTLLETNLLPQRIESDFLSLGSLKKNHIGTLEKLMCLCGFSSSLKNECFELLRFIQCIVGSN